MQSVKDDSSLLGRFDPGGRHLFSMLLNPQGLPQDHQDPLANLTQHT